MGVPCQAARHVDCRKAGIARLPTCQKVFEGIVSLDANEFDVPVGCSNGHIIAVDRHLEVFLAGLALVLIRWAI